MWQDLLGHDAIIDQFRQRVANGRLASTYLFLGLEGIGKHAFARRLAAALLCPKSVGAALDPCGQCESCLLVSAGNHPDLDEVALPEGKKTLPIDLFLGDREHRNREGLCHAIALRPLMGQRRIAIIDDADWLSIESANCLLKTLEEPPRGSLIILIGTSRSRQLPTILSRTQLVQFAPLRERDLAELIIAQGVADPGQADELARCAGGSLARARQLADAAATDFAARLARQASQGELELRPLATQLTELVNSVGTDAQDRRMRLRQLALNTADCLRLELRELCRRGLPAERLAGLIDRCLDVELHVERNANQNLVVESWLNDLASL